MKKILSIVLVLCMIFSLAGCASSEEQTDDKQNAVTNGAEEKKDNNTAGTETTPAPTKAPAEPTPTDIPVEVIEDVDEIKELTGGQLVDGKFPETKHIDVEVYDRGGATEAANNMYTEYIKKGVLEKYNIDVNFIAVDRWTEVDQINNLLAAGDAPDVCYSYDYNTVLAYADMDGIADMSEWLADEYKGLFPNLWNWLGTAGMNYHKDAETGTVYAIEGKRTAEQRINTFVRQDWLDALGLAAPTTTAEFEAMLVAFKDNADTLLGADASKMIPYGVTYDVGWTAATLIESKIDPDITDEDAYVYGYDDRKLLVPGTKDAIQLLNQWYNKGLLWNDFALYGSGDSTFDDMLKAGYVGAFTQNFDYPFRDGEDSINYQLKSLVGENAKFVAIDPFEDSKGTHTKYLYNTVGTDRKIFFPKSNEEILASLLYLDYISDPSVVEYLQIGDEGITHTVAEDGTILVQAADEAHVANTINSLYNIDYTMTTNGLRLSTDEMTFQSMSYSYANVDPADVTNSLVIAMVDGKTPVTPNGITIDAEVGMGSSLSALRDVCYDKAVSAPEADFEATWESCMADYLAAGGQDIIDERQQKWDDTYGDAVMLP